jgi:hypothetical protein
MKLFKVTNGYIGFVDVNALVIAKDEGEALESARLKFKNIVDKETEDINKQIEDYRNKFADKLEESLKPKYDENYYNDLKAICLCDNVSNNWIEEIEE